MVFWILIILFVLFLYFILSFKFDFIGRIFIKIFKNFKENIEESKEDDLNNEK